MSHAEKQPLLAGGGGSQQTPYPPAAAPVAAAPYPPAGGQPGAGGYQTAGGAPPASAPAASAQEAGPAMQGGTAAAPLLEHMEKVAGYEGVGFSEGRV